MHMREIPELMFPIYFHRSYMEYNKTIGQRGFQLQNTIFFHTIIHAFLTSNEHEAAQYACENLHPQG